MRFVPRQERSGRQNSRGDRAAHSDGTNASQSRVEDNSAPTWRVRAQRSA